MLSIITPSIRPHWLDITQKCLENQTFQDFEWIVEVGLRNRGFTLPSDLNKAIKRAKGKRIVMLQDCIHIEPDTLARINDLQNDFITFPVGKVKELGNNPEWDWRIHESGVVQPQYWEADFACAPTQAFFDVGGYDEDYNNGWSWENVEIAYRAAIAGYQFFCNPTIKGVAIDHDAKEENPWRGKRENNDKRAMETRYRAERGEFRLGYL